MAKHQLMFKTPGLVTLTTLAAALGDSTTRTRALLHKNGIEPARVIQSGARTFIQYKESDALPVIGKRIAEREVERAALKKQAFPEEPAPAPIIEQAVPTPTATLQIAHRLAKLEKIVGDLAEQISEQRASISDMSAALDTLLGSLTTPDFEHPPQVLNGKANNVGVS